MKFLCDRMLGSLAKWLRIYGFDTIYADINTSDEEILNIAKEENRKLITRGIELSYQGRRENLDVIKLQTTDLDEQIKIILRDTKIDDAKFLSRCTICNELVTTVKKEEIKGRVPKKVLENNHEFWFCKKCEKVYWKGSHCDEMLKKTKRL